MRPPCGFLVLAAAATIAWFALDTRTAASYNHITNGGFEAGAAGWSVSPGATLSVADASEVPPADGVRSARIGAGDVSVSLWRALDGALGTGTYALSMQVRSAGEPIDVSMRVRLNADPSWRVDIVGTAAAGGWSMVSGAVTVPISGVASVIIEADTSPGDVIHVDDIRVDGAPPVTVTATHTPPPPATASAIAAGTTLPAAGTATATRTVIATHTAMPHAIEIGRTLLNAGFEDTREDGAPAFWEKYGGTLTWSSDHARNGARAARLESATDSTKWLHQMVRVDPGQSYAFDAWIWHDDPNVASTFLRVSWYASDDGSGTALGTDDSPERLEEPSSSWRYLTTGSVAAPAGAHSARVRVMLHPASAAPAAIFVDDAGFGTAPPADIHAAAGAGTTATSTSRERSAGNSAVHSVTRSRAAPGVAQTAGGRVVINEVLYDFAGEGADADGEWVELFNAGESAVNIGGWTLADDTGTDVLPASVIEAGGFAIVAASDSVFTSYPDAGATVLVLGGRIGNGLGNDGDGLRLIDGTGTVIDAVSWGDDGSVFMPGVDDVPAGHSIERSPAGADTGTAADFVDNERPTPGRALDVLSGADGNPISQSGASVEELRGAGAERLSWAPWAFAAASGAALAGAAGWRTLEMVRQRRQA